MVSGLMIGKMGQNWPELWYEFTQALGTRIAMNHAQIKSNVTICRKISMKQTKLKK